MEAASSTTRCLSARAARRHNAKAKMKRGNQYSERVRDQLTLLLPVLAPVKGANVEGWRLNAQPGNMPIAHPVSSGLELHKRRTQRPCVFGN